jgi:hypothetical protein
MSLTVKQIGIFQYFSKLMLLLLKNSQPHESLNCKIKMRGILFHFVSVLFNDNVNFCD